ncbi:MAG: tRNA (N6-isopentenyl adenosine(37)-C2)-methylthiotransferase MiaB, partial [Anaerotignum sp.]|nr:tRNA (N6-isopentenyl adenosine(37)-C2)-methylthiotransferase MiaB [Anaerotignum sp.]
MENRKNSTTLADETELMRQLEYIRQIRQENDAFEAKTGQKKKFYSLAMGCQMNAHDSEKLEGMLTEMGYERTQEEKEADFVIYNTCCVRENAELKVYGKLGWLKHYKETQNPDALIALCGCMMQQETVLQTLRQKHRHVDIVFGTFNLYKLPELVATRMESGETVYDIWQEQQEVVEDLPSIRHFPYKASVNIMFGCNNFCSYCIVPYVRGRERSRTPEEILAEVRKLAADGVKEIMLLGQKVNSYGKNLETPISFAELLRQVNEVEGIERIRFMTSHPKDLSDELIEAMAQCDKVCKYMHLPVQSGSDEVLRRMNRHYTKESYLELVRKLRAAMPGITLSTDIIVGFPGETEEDFQETLDVIRQARYSTAFTFIYSKRTGTPAAVMEDQVDEATAQERFNRLLALVQEGAVAACERHQGEVQEILVESLNEKDGTLV